MACPTCDHTMQCVNDNVFWCSRCGTLRDVMEVSPPKLVSRVNELINLLGTVEWADTEQLLERMRIMGIQESVSK